ncbi:hypothetical protein AHiyo6_09110 [Arthrobacter sp. Hiyo6]|jgi:hypothetical protein|nr:hypothetical protein AHiyo6_09110 [Arthrobacter sp. Hiyo6]
MPQNTMLDAFPHQAQSMPGSPGAPPPQVNLEPIRRQSRDIINAILMGTDPESSLIREQLRRCLYKYRGNPERALLMHLMSMPGRGAPPVID